MTSLLLSEEDVAQAIADYVKKIAGESLASKISKATIETDKEGDNFVLYDQQSWAQEAVGELKTVFKDGKLVSETSVTEIRNRLWN